MSEWTPPSRATVTHPCFKPPRSGGGGASPPRAPEGPFRDRSPFLLDQIQTSSQVPVALEDSRYDQWDRTPESIPFEHTGWHHTRMKVREALILEELPPARVWKFGHCGDDVFIYQNTTDGEIDFHGSRCGDRFCMVCGAIRSRRIAQSLRELIAKEQPLFITLTVQGKPGDSLASMLDRLADGWKQLRRLDHWKERIRGGAIMLEVKYSRDSGGHWHPHYHILAHGKFIEKEWLKEAWHLITRDSFIVDIKRVHELEGALGYVTKYASKPMDSSFTQTPNLLREAIRTLRGRRLCACFGDWYGTPLNERVDDEEDDTEVLTSWRFLGSKSDLEFKASRGDAMAGDVLRTVERLARLRHAFTVRATSPPKARDAAGPAVDACGIAGDAA